MKSLVRSSVHSWTRSNVSGDNSDCLVCGSQEKLCVVRNCVSGLDRERVWVGNGESGCVCE